MSSQVRNTRPIDVRQNPVESPKYLDFIRKQECETCPVNEDGEKRTVPFWFQGIFCKVEAAHTGNVGKGMGIKASDVDAIPLCTYCHTISDTSPHRMGSEKKWAKFHKLDLPAIRARLWAEFERRFPHAAKALRRVA